MNDINTKKAVAKPAQGPGEHEKSFTDWLERNISGYQKTLDEFAADIKRNPYGALDWSSKAFDAAAMIKVFDSLRANVEDLGFAKGVTVSQLEMQEQAVNRAMYPQCSTSVPSNFANQCLTSALLYVCRDLRHWVRISQELETAEEAA